MYAFAMPAQFTKTFNFPCCFSMLCTSLLISSGDLMSDGTNWTFEPIVLAISFPFEVGKSHMITLAPFFTNRSTVAKPSPDEPPVTSATKFCFFPLLKLCRILFFE